MLRHFFYKKRLEYSFLIDKNLNQILQLLLLSLLITSCGKKNGVKSLQLDDTIYVSIEIPKLSVDKAQISYDNITSKFSMNNQPFSGYIVSFYQDSMLKEKIGIYNGKKQNKATYWFPNGKLKEVSNYSRGKLHGEKKLWSNKPSHMLIASLNYYSGKATGEQKQWYKTGELYKKLNLNMGKEEGIQQAFRKNGDLYANYEAKNGRIFGEKKTALCYGLEDESIKKYKK